MTDGKETTCGDNVLKALVIVAVIAIVGLFIWLFVMDSRMLEDPPVYSISIAGVAGLDVDELAGDGHPTLSPVFNLTLCISNTRNEYDRACVPELSTASVSYGDAFLGKGSVGQFCTEPKGESEGQARAWGQDVAMPRFLRDQLAGELQRGEAAVDVALKMPSGCSMVACFDKLLLCKAKVRGGPPCKMSVRDVQS